MSENEKNIVIAQMETRRKSEWMTADRAIQNNHKNAKRLLRNTSVFAVVSLCLGTAFLSWQGHDGAQTVMSHMTAGFEYDETLGRLQFVSNILPSSAMVFLQEGDAELIPVSAVPNDAQTTHAWSQEEPWIEYACVGDVMSCQDGEIMTIVRNADQQYTVRVLHENGYESIYSGLSAVYKDEFERIQRGEQIGTASGSAAFELRRDGLSVQPVFAEH